MTEKEKMLSGQVYNAADPILLEELAQARLLVRRYNDLQPSETGKMTEILHELLGGMADDEAIINQPFRCDYGKQIRIGKRFFANFGFTVLDEAPVTIGDDCFIGPNVSIYTACHSTDPVERNSRREWALPVSIGNNVWIGGSVTILPGVTIGNGVTIGAGSVVTKDIPSGVVAVGNPCRIIKKLALQNLDMTSIETTKAPGAIGPYSQAVDSGAGLVFVSGQLPIDPSTGAFPEGGVKEQTRQSLLNASAILEAAGLSLASVVKTTVFLADMADFAAMNEVYAQFFKAPFPARSAVAVKTLPKGALVEIECIASAK